MAHKPLSLLASLLAFSVTSSLAAPPTNPPKITLAPGLPTLESLGLTAADLYKPDFLESRGISIPASPTRPAGSPTVKDTIPACYTDAPALRGDAIACRNALISMGTSFCDVAGDYSVLCQSGSVEIVGWNYYNVTTGVAADCSDVAIGASWVIDNCSSCSQDDCAVEGDQIANGISNYVVFVDHNLNNRADEGGLSRPWA